MLCREPIQVFSGRTVYLQAICVTRSASCKNLTEKADAMTVCQGVFFIAK